MSNKYSCMQRSVDANVCDKTNVCTDANPYTCSNCVTYDYDIVCFVINKTLHNVMKMPVTRLPYITQHNLILDLATF